MIVNQIVIQTCQLFIIINLTYTYVLFAANLDDFRSIAKKFIPGKLADQLTEMAAQNSKKYRQQKQEVINKDTNEESDERGDPTPQLRQIQVEQKKRFAIKGQTQQLDFDQLVAKVRQQLEKESKYKQNEAQENQAYHSKKEMVDRFAENNKDLYEKPTKKSPKPQVNTEASTTQDSQIYYEYEEKEPAAPVAEEEDGLFQEGDLTKTNDSYEDYVTPEKDNIFESDTETKSTNSIPVPSEIESRYQGQRLKAVNTENNDKKSVDLVDSKAYYDEQVPLAENNDGPVLWVDDENAPLPKKALAQVVPLSEHNDQRSAEYEQEYKEHKSGEVKAQTGKLFDDIPDNKPKKLKGTMIPTRQYFKMSSPNYYKKLPAVAEKYDFNEPLPEKDREPEKLKHFPNPPAMINKKVRIDK